MLLCRWFLDVTKRQGWNWLGSIQYWSKSYIGRKGSNRTSQLSTRSWSIENGNNLNEEARISHSHLYGDFSDLYDTISKESHQACHITSKGTHCPTHMKDIANLARGNKYNFCFQKIERSCNVVTDKLAKWGSITNSNYVVIWKNNM